MENQVTLEGLATVNLNSKFSVDDNKWKHTLALSMSVAEEDIEAVRILTLNKGTWFVNLAVEGIQGTLDEAMLKDQAAGMESDPTVQARIEEAAGQKVG